MEETYKNLGWNITCLRVAFHETEEQLAESIGVTRQAIWNYEYYSKIPTRDIIVKIANHYRITENELLYGDFSWIKYPGNKLEDIEGTKVSVDIAFPLISSEKALNNRAFKNAFASHIAMYTNLKRAIPVSDSEYGKCLQLYEDALDSGIIEAAANLLWWILAHGLGYACYEMLDGYESLRQRRISGEQFLQRYYLRNCNDESNEITPEVAELRREQRQYLQENEKRIQSLLRVLKSSTDYSDLADYYLALRYIFGVVYNSNSDALNKAIGEEMMTAFALWENKYVLNFLKIGQ